jgi:hypothetical protein
VQYRARKDPGADLLLDLLYQQSRARHDVCRDASIHLAAQLAPCQVVGVGTALVVVLIWH